MNICQRLRKTANFYLSANSFVVFSYTCSEILNKITRPNWNFMSWLKDWHHSVCLYNVRSSFSRLGRLADNDDIPANGEESRASKISSRKSRTMSQASKTRTDQASTPTSKAKQGPKSAGSSGGSAELIFFRNVQQDYQNSSDFR